VQKRQAHKLSTLLMSSSLEQNFIDATIKEWRKLLTACVHAGGQHFEHFMSFLSD